jgi:undecaprenyl diphosphate synthase
VTIKSNLTLNPSVPRNIPLHVAIIMDGNGRWAQAHGLPRVLGHRAGTQNVRSIIAASIEQGIRYLTLYAFSTENWSRPGFEVKALMQLLSEYIDRETPHLHRMGVQIRHLGRMNGLSRSLQNKIHSAVNRTKGNSSITVSVALNYGARDDIVQAVRAILDSGITSDQLTEKHIADYLGTHGIPEPDLVIRTSGEYRLSNFLVWEMAYSELWFTPTLWPDFTSQTLDQAVVEYSQRKRRFGGLLDPHVSRVDASVETRIDS